jgi:hypothetical protein
VESTIVLKSKFTDRSVGRGDVFHAARILAGYKSRVELAARLTERSPSKTIYTPGIIRHWECHGLSDIDRIQELMDFFKDYIVFLSLEPGVVDLPIAKAGHRFAISFQPPST